MVKNQEEIRALLIDAKVIQSGHFKLNSGVHSNTYLEKFNLLQWPDLTEIICKDIYELTKDLQPDLIVGPTTGGAIIAYEVARNYRVRSIIAEKAENGRVIGRDYLIEPGEKVLVVDDILTSGQSVFETMDAVKNANGTVVGVAIIADRSMQPIHFNVPSTSLVKITLENYEENECPLCKNNVPLKIT